MTSEQKAIPVSDAREIERMVNSACDGGEPDHYAGKRQWPRFAAGTRLEITTDPNNRSSTWPAIMHNVSTGGIAFWSKRELRERDEISVREFPTDGSTPWIPARVQHCTVGIRGFLIGVEFESPPPPGSSPD